MTKYNPKTRKTKKSAKAKPKRASARGGGVSTVDVKRIVNSMTAKKTETKILRGFGYEMQVGQINSDGPGYLTKELTGNMLMSTGTSNTNRIGNEVAFTSAHFNIQITEQSNATSAAAQFQFMIVKDMMPNDNIYTTGDINNPVESMYLQNPFIRSAGGFDVDIKTYGSQKNLMYMGKRFTILAKKNISLKADSLANTDNRNITFTMGINLKKPIIMKYNGNLTSNYIYNSGGGLFLLVFCSAGNCGGASTLGGGIPRSAIDSGYNIAYNVQNYFKDY